MSPKCSWALLVALGVGGCDRKSETSAPTPPVETTSTQQAPPSTPATTAPAAAARAQIDEIPTEQDFEEEAAREITAENLEAELDKLEREIGE